MLFDIHCDSKNIYILYVARNISIELLCTNLKLKALLSYVTTI